MLGAKKCKQVEPLHYIGPPLHSHTPPPPTVYFYVNVSYTHTVSHTQSPTFHHHFSVESVCFAKATSPVICDAVGPQASKQHPTSPQGAFFFSPNTLWSGLSMGSVCVWEREYACMCVSVEKVLKERQQDPYYIHFLPALHFPTITSCLRFCSFNLSLFLSLVPSIFHTALRGSSEHSNSILFFSFNQKKKIV